MPEFEFGRRYSQTVYEAFAVRSVHISNLDVLERAVLPIRGSATTVDIGFFWNSESTAARNGQIVFLNSHNSIVTAFANRCDIDVEYPSRGMIGFPDRVKNKKVSFCKKDRQCIHLNIQPTTNKPAEVSPGSAFYRVYDSHDLTLIYFNEADAAAFAPPKLPEIEDPESDLSRYSDSAERIFDQRMVVLSQRCFKRMLRQLEQPRDLGFIADLALSMLISRGLRPLLGLLGSRNEIPKQVLEAAAHDFIVHRKEPSNPRTDELSMGQALNVAKAILTTSTSELWTTFKGSHLPKKGPRAVRLAGTITEDRRLNAQPSGNNIAPLPSLALVGVILPPLNAPEGKAVAEYIHQTTQDTDVQFVDYGEQRGVIFLPHVSMVLNYELLRHGLAKFDIHDEVARDRFPELSKAAVIAVQQGAGFAGAWSTNKEYLSAIMEADKPYIPYKFRKK